MWRYFKAPHHPNITSSSFYRWVAARHISRLTEANRWVFIKCGRHFQTGKKKHATFSLPSESRAGVFYSSIMSQLKVCLVFSSLTTRRQAFSSSQPRLKWHFAIMSSLTAEYLSFHNDQPVGAACVCMWVSEIEEFCFPVIPQTKEISIYRQELCLLTP